MKKKKKATVFRISNNKNEKVYVGCSLGTLPLKIESYYDELKKTFHGIKTRNSKLLNAIIRIGLDNFRVETLEVVDADDRFSKTSEWIIALNSRNKGYNHKSRTELDKKEKEEIVKFWKAGASETRLSEIYHTCRKTIRGLLRERGLKEAAMKEPQVIQKAVQIVYSEARRDAQ